MNHGKVSPELAKGLLELKRRIKLAAIPSSKVDESINIATWNIRAFGQKKRSEAAVHYIAEIIGQFDLVSIVELRDNLEDLNRVLAILGPTWRAVYSDFIDDAGGNRERIAFVYDKRQATFNGLAAQAQPPRTKVKGDYVAGPTWWRSPYMASFRSGSFDFVALSAHIQWGTEAGRAEELERLANWIEAKRTSKNVEDKDWIVMGDFNIPDARGKLFQAITKNGLQIPAGLRGKEFGTNLEKDKRYDQILHHPLYPETFSNKGGVLDFHLNDDQIGGLFPSLKDKKELYTFEMSDHLPLWIQVKTDVDGFKLEQLIKG